MCEVKKRQCEANLSLDEAAMLAAFDKEGGTNDSDHPVWKILRKEAYVEEFYAQAEEMYRFIKAIVKLCGNTTKDNDTVPTMKVFFDMWNEYSSETFAILGALVRDIDIVE